MDFSAVHPVAQILLALGAVAIGLLAVWFVGRFIVGD